jgi:chromosome segregation ATPase
MDALALEWALVEEDRPLHERVVNQGEEALGKLAQDLLESPVVSGALSAVFGTRERAMRAQEVTLAALNLPSASDLERLTRRIRNVSQRLEGIEDALDRLEQRMAQLGQGSPDERDLPALKERLDALEAALERVESALAASKPAA